MLNKNEHEEVDSDSIRCSSDVAAGTSQRMVGHTPTELSRTLFQKIKAMKVTCKIGLGDEFVLRFVLLNCSFFCI